MEASKKNIFLDRDFLHVHLYGGERVYICKNQ
jgi:hypothetical protein